MCVCVCVCVCVCLFCSADQSIRIQGRIQTIVVITVMRSADQPSRRNQTGVNNERFVGWCAGSSFG